VTSLEIWAPFAVFAFVAAATPGPNNLLLLTSGLRVGLWRTVPFIIGISVGFSILLVATGYGLGRMFERFPLLHPALKILGTGYFLVLAWSLLRPGPARDGGGGRHLGFWAGLVFQAVNPKAWLMAITAIALYLPQGWTPATIALMASVFVLVAFPANMAWAGAGQALRALVADAGRMRLFNMVMAALLVLSILPVWLPRP
jgi:threonine/homoserine/homoserine lactone efflux protein